VARSLVIVNPGASRIRDPATRRTVSRELEVVLGRRDGQPPEIVETTAAGESPTRVAEAVQRGAPAVVGVGGDGTLRELAASLAGTQVPLGIVPAGTGNQVAAVLGVPLSMRDAVSALETERQRSLDLGEVRLRSGSGGSRSTSGAERSGAGEGPPEAAGDRTLTFILGCGAGLDARLMATTSSASKQRYGKSAYLAQGLRLAMRIDVTPVRIDVDGERIETDASLALIGNMGHLIPGVIGSRLPLDPGDGLLDLIVVAARGPIHGLKGLLDQLTRTALGGGSGSDSLRLRGRHITIESDAPLPLQVDGDYVGEGSLSARVRPASLEVLLPELGRPSPAGTGPG
jgi:diacylglycerol kinase family enzyme